MNDLPNSTVARREWLRGWLRCAALGGISLVSGGLLLRRADPAGQASCRRAPACGDCVKLATCPLGPAMQTKRERSHDRAGT